MKNILKEGNKVRRKTVAFALVFLLISALFDIDIFADAVPNKNERVYVTLDKAKNYNDYISSLSEMNKAFDTVEVDIKNPASSKGKIKLYDSYKGMKDSSLYTGDNGYVEWDVDIKNSGLYQMQVEYYPVKGRATSIERSIYIDNVLPFSEVRSVIFNRIWHDIKNKDGKTIISDKNGNDIRPEQQEKPRWCKSYITDSVGYESEPLEFYFTGGKHKIRFVSIREPLMIHSIKLCRKEDENEYEAVKMEYERNGYNSAKGDIVKIQAEQPYEKSDSTIVASFDRSTSFTEPNDPVYLKLNTIGGSSMQASGQWLSWEFTVPNSGLYEISFKAIQNTLNGSVSSRRIYIDGKVPFRELNNVEFPYSNNWKIYTLGDSKDDYEFYLEAGKHQIKMEVVLGNVSSLVRKVSEAVDELNKIYRNILVITGPTPDTNRDYRFEKVIPEVLSDLKTQGEILTSVYTSISKMAGMSGENIQTLVKFTRQIKKMCDKPEKIAGQFSSFQSNITSLATWVMDAKKQPLTLDYILISPSGKKLPSAKGPILNEILYHTKSFLSSFSHDYNNFSSEDGEKSVSVWVGSGMTGGRDQAQILKNISENYFTPKSGISVNISLVAMASLLPATLTGKGPDVALSLDSSEVANYAFREAATDISSFEGFSEVIKSFNKSALEPLSFNDGVYGLPETQTYPVMFYRKDILSELGIDIPQTWDDVIRILPILQKKQLNFGLPTASGNGTSMTAFTMLLYQYNGSLYKNNGIASNINTDVGLDAFSFLTSLYNDYELDQVLDFSNRFRSGAVPIGIADYSAYNQLSVFAPELDGLWDFSLVPGIMKKDGKINRTVPTTVSACMMLYKSKNKKNAWEFMKWWVGKESQVKFGRELESVMGTAARYPTANRQAMYQIPWSISTFDILQKQGKLTRAIPQVPGSYYTPRYIDFAFRDVVNLGVDPGEAIVAAEKSINFELTAKRKEFGLPVL